MFETLLRRLLAPAPAPLADTDARLALAALMVRIARADGHYDPTEVARIDRLLGGRYGLDAAAAAALRAEAEVLETEAPDTVRFTRAIKDAVPYEDRRTLMEALWSVALADGARDDGEDRLLRLVANLLGVTDRDSALARQRAGGAP
ncbi:MAG: TerB family tellurite resistance protein [Gemmobacter sp.]